MEQVEIERLIGELEIAVDRLRSLYEQYFMGIEKLEPTVPRKDVDRRIHVLRKEQIRNTALRFRFHMLLQRYNTYQTHWQRICRDIENGTYKRHVLRAQQRFAPGRSGTRSSRPPRKDASVGSDLAELEQEFAPAETLDDGDFLSEEDPATTRKPGGSVRPPASRPAPVSPRTAHPPRSHPPPRAAASPARTPPPPRNTPPPRTPPPARSSSRTLPPPAARGVPKAPPSSRSVVSPRSPRPSSAPRPAAAPRPPSSPRVAAAASNAQPADLPDARVRQLYAQYVETKRRQNESTAAITYEAVARSLRESSAKLKQKLGRSVDFEVVVKDGRAVLRPVVK